MTTPWTIKPIWKGETVAVLASGPSMNKAVAESLRSYKCIAVNHTHQLAPWADMMVALDRNLGIWCDARNFAGMRISGVESDDVDALYCGPMHERVRLGPSHVVEILNSGLAAIRIAVQMGAVKIILAGFDPHLAPTGKYVGLERGLAALIAELRASGITVERIVCEDVSGMALPKAAKIPVKRARRKKGS